MIAKLVGFFKLIRVKNLLFIVLTQYLTKYFIIEPIFTNSGWFNITVPELTNFHFFLLVLSTVLIAAAGNIINDYFDVKIDAINKPDRIIIDRLIKRRVAMAIHLIFNITGVAIGVYLALLLGNLKLGSFHIATAAILWFYSTNFKRQLVIGNFVVSFLTALVILLVGFYDPRLYTYTPNALHLDAAKTILIILAAYSFFAFMVSMIREIVKDMEDAQGDARYDCRTIPIVFGLHRAKVVVYVLTVVTILGLGFIQYRLYQFQFWQALVFVSVGLQIPLLYVIWKVYQAETKQHFHTASNFVKMVMLLGILSMLFIYTWFW